MERGAEEIRIVRKRCIATTADEKSVHALSLAAGMNNGQLVSLTGEPDGDFAVKRAKNLSHASCPAGKTCYIFPAFFDLEWAGATGRLAQGLATGGAVSPEIEMGNLINPVALASLILGRRDLASGHIERPLSDGSVHAIPISECWKMADYIRAMCSEFDNVLQDQ